MMLPLFLCPSLEHHVPLMIFHVGEAGATSGGISDPDSVAGSGTIQDAGVCSTFGVAADTSSPYGSPIGTIAI